MKRFALVLCVVNIVMYSYSQIQMQLIVHPSTPKVGDSLVVEARVALLDGCLKRDSSVLINGSNIDLSACYLYGWGSAGQVWRDTAYYYVGTLAENSYSLKYVVHATKTNGDSLCANYLLLDSEIVSFSVVPNSIIMNDISDPSQEFANLVLDNLSAGKLDITISDVCGKLVNTIYEGNSNGGKMSCRINTQNLPNGIYFVSVRMRDSFQTLKLIRQ
jgi:hypothetical protein